MCLCVGVVCMGVGVCVCVEEKGNIGKETVSQERMHCSPCLPQHISEKKENAGDNVKGFFMRGPN